MFAGFRAWNKTQPAWLLTTAGVGTAAKLLGLTNQIISVALISGALGADGLQQQLLAISLVSWFSLTLCGMHTSLPVLLIRSAGRVEVFAGLAKTAFVLATAGGLSALGLMLILLEFGWMSSASPVLIITAAICNTLGLSVSLSERVFQATDRIAQFNMLGMAGTLISLAATAILAFTHPSVAGFIVSYFLSLVLPVIAAGLMIIPDLQPGVRLSRTEFTAFAKQLIGIGVFGLGYEVAAYCNLQAPLALLSALGYSDEIAPVGIGLRLVTLLSGGLSIIVPILLLRIGTAVQSGDQRDRLSWSRFGLALAAGIAIASAGLFVLFGQDIYRLWTGGAVPLHHPLQLSLATFAALYLAQNLLFPLAAPDTTVASRLRWLFWFEGLAALAVGAIAVRAFPDIGGGAAMLGGATLVVGIANLVLLVLLARSVLRSTNFR